MRRAAPGTPTPTRYTYAWFRGDGDAARHRRRPHRRGRRHRPVLHGRPRPALTTATSADRDGRRRPRRATPENRTPPALTGDAAAARHARSAAPARGTARTRSRYRWLRDGAAIAGATQATYVVVVADVGHALRCEVSVGAVAALSQAVTIAAAGRARRRPRSAATRAPRGTLRCSTGSWDGDYAYIYQWLRDGVAVGGRPTVDRVLDAGRHRPRRSRARSTRRRAGVDDRRPP